VASDAHEALAAARKLLGNSAIVEQRTRAAADGIATAYFVGTIGPDPFNWNELGRGSTWAEALRAASKGRTR
jgi:hypothetical protein